MPREYKTATNGGQGNYMIIVMPRKVPISKCSLPYENKTSGFSNSSGLKSVFQKLRFRDRLAGVDVRPCRGNEAALFSLGFG